MQAHWTGGSVLLLLPDPGPGAGRGPAVPCRVPERRGVQWNRWRRALDSVLAHETVLHGRRCWS